MRRGFTIIEILVVTFVLGVLVALLLPAIQSARQSGRRVTCANNLRQIGIAFEHYYDTYGKFNTRFQPQRSILPFLGHTTTLNALETSDVLPELGVTIFVCPEDAFAIVELGTINYFPNQGIANAEGSILRFAGAVKSSALGDYLTKSDIRDGLSSTVFYSERLSPPFDRDRGNGSLVNTATSDESDRLFGYVDRTYTLPNEVDAFGQACRDRRTIGLTFHPTHYLGLEQSFGYNHIDTPNRLACHNGDSSNSVHPNEANCPATSADFSGVHSLQFDGSVRFVNNSNDRSVWRALGSRDGREAMTF